MKPSNVLVTIQGDKPVPKIIDFGVAKATAQRLTERTLFTALGQWIGTPEYMSPEQAEMAGLDIDTRTDVYSLGVVLYELLVGAQPFDAKEFQEVGFDEMRRKILEEEPTRPSTKVSSMGEASTTAARNRQTALPALARELRGDLDWITMKALEKDRTRRYGSPAELAADIGRHLRNEPVLAGPPSTVYQAGKFIRRHRAGVIAVALVVATLLIGIAGTTLGLLRARREAESAQQVSEVLQEIFEELNPHLRRFVTASPEEVLDRGVERIEVQLEGQPLVQARLMRTMGYSYMELGLYERARRLFEKSIEIHREHLGEEHPDFALSISFLGDVLIMVGDYEEAQRLHEQALAIRQKVLEPGDLTVAWSLRSLATAHRMKAEYERARSLFRQALEIGEKALGPDNEDVAITLDLHAQLEMETGNYTAARPLLERAIEIRKESLGPEHAHVAFSLGGLARLLYFRGEYESSQSLGEQAVKILEKVFAPSHPAVAYPLNQLAGLHLYLGHYEEARRLYQRAVEIRERALGPNHVELSESLHGLGRLHLLTGDDEAARPLLERALEISEKPSRSSRGAGRLAPHTSDEFYRAGILNSLGILLSRTGETEKARRSHELAMEILEKTFGPNHPDLALPLNDLGNLLLDAGDHEAARTLLERALEIRERALGPDHAGVAEVLQSLAVLHHRDRNYESSQQLFERALKISEGTLGPTHPFVKGTLEDYADLLRETDQNSKADELETRVKAIEAKLAKDPG
jgi:non-specific serine/threonine protein kinase/serine/threonine-protein kinase